MRNHKVTLALALLATSFVFQPAHAADTTHINTVASNGVLTAVAIAVPQDGVGWPVVVYIDDSGVGDSPTAKSLMFVRCTSVDCSTHNNPVAIDGHSVNLNVEVSSDFGGGGLLASSINASVVLDSTNHPVFSYWDKKSGGIRVAKCSTSDCTGTITRTVVDNSGQGQQLYSSLAIIGADGNPVLAYGDDDGGKLNLVRCVDGGCTSPVTPVLLDQGNGVGRFASLALDNVGLPAVAYQAWGAKSLKVVKCGTVTCTGPGGLGTPQVIADANNGSAQVGGYISMKLDAQGRPIVSFWDEGVQGLRVAHCTLANCAADSGNSNKHANVNSVDDPAITGVGQFAFMTINPGTGNPVISYYGDANGVGGLKLAHCSSVDCAQTQAEAAVGAQSTPVDYPIFGSGGGTSVAIGLDTFPIIAYVGADGVRVAKCVTVDCSPSAP